MSPEIFFDDFERTENSDYLHGVFGRCLVIATRFDSMCVRLSQAIKLKEEVKLRTLEKYLGEFKHEVRQFEKSYDNQQAEQISLMV